MIVFPKLPFRAAALPASTGMETFSNMRIVWALLGRAYYTCESVAPLRFLRIFIQARRVRAVASLNCGIRQEWCRSIYRHFSTTRELSKADSLADTYQRNCLIPLFSNCNIVAIDKVNRPLRFATIPD